MLLVLSLILFIIGAILGLLQLWFVLFDPDTFLKIEFSIVVLFTIFFAIWFFIKEYRENEKNKDSKYLD